MNTDEHERVERLMNKLVPHLLPEKFVVVGGLAITHHLLAHGIQCDPRPFNDLDIIILDPNCVQSSVAKDFLIYHYHLLASGFPFIALFDLDTKIKIDIFPPSIAPTHNLKVVIGKYEVQMASPEDQLANAIQDTQKVLGDHPFPVDPKQFRDVRALLQIVGSEPDMLAAFKKAENIVAKRPELLKEKPFRKSKPYKCAECVTSSVFPVAPMNKIYEVLGYVE